jgi:hypothetical protein
MNMTFTRMIGAARLDAHTYEEVEANPATTAGAIFVVLAASVAAAIGIGVTDPAGILGVTLGALATWLVWVGLTYIIGTRVIPEGGTHSTIGEVVRTTGFSAAPGVLRIFGFLPVIGWAIFFGVTIWMLFAFVVAIRQAMDFQSSARALLVCLLGWLIHGVLFFAFVVPAV